MGEVSVCWIYERYFLFLTGLLSDEAHPGVHGHDVGWDTGRVHNLGPTQLLLECHEGVTIPLRSIGCDQAIEALKILGGDKNLTHITLFLCFYGDHCGSLTDDPTLPRTLDSA
jgi:hypothetical protein